jgi:Lrp/AsnC family transcriptional regulator, leucine-responsive regulatory protein
MTTGIKRNPPSTSKQTRTRALNTQPPPSIDAIDRQILVMLQDDARLSYSEIGRRVHLTQPAVAERIHALEENGAITGYHAQVNPAALGYPIHTFITVDSRTIKETHNVLASAATLPEVVEAYTITGNVGVLLRVVAVSLDRLDQIIHIIAEHSGPTTHIVLRTHIARRTINPITAAPNLGPAKRVRHR